MLLIRILRFILLLLVTACFLVFAVTNRQDVSLNISPFPYYLEIRLFIFTGFLLCLGIVVGSLYTYFACLEKRSSYNYKETRNRLLALQEENARLQALIHLEEMRQK